MNAMSMARCFAIGPIVMSAEPYGNGHINNTYRVVTPEGAYILQRVNRYVFKKPEQVMDNIVRVTDHLQRIIRSEGGDPRRETLTLVPSLEGGTHVLDEEGELWRMYLCIEGVVTRDLPDMPEIFALSGEAFGRFQSRLGEFDASLLHETIPNFHNTPARYRQLMDAVAEDRAGRLRDVSSELAFARAREAETRLLLDEVDRGTLPIRVTHNDTKLNNVLLDRASGEGVCVIDLDTVMPGLVAYDFGDAIRTGASTAAEDEEDLAKVDISLPMFEAFARGFLSRLRGILTPREIELLPMGAKMMTLENGLRFLADHLNGDLYFRVHRAGHNLARARAQFRLVQRMEEKWEDMQRIVARL